jgi:ubiquinol-cytochrome c reductase cytochrome c subunit
MKSTGMLCFTNGAGGWRAAPLLLLAAVAALFLAPTIGRAQTAKAGAAPAGNAKNGEKLFVSYGCYSCHGRHAEGSSATGPRLGPNAVTLGLLQKYIRQPTGQMPPYTTKVVSDADLVDVFAFLQSLPQPPKADSIPELK